VQFLGLLSVARLLGVGYRCTPPRGHGDGGGHEGVGWPGRGGVDGTGGGEGGRVNLGSIVLFLCTLTLRPLLLVFSLTHRPRHAHTQVKLSPSFSFFRLESYQRPASTQTTLTLTPKLQTPILCFQVGIIPGGNVGSSDNRTSHTLSTANAASIPRSTDVRPPPPALPLQDERFYARHSPARVYT
jgi:hypothetical protein